MSVDVITIGCEGQLQKRNRLKGLAMQKLIQLTMPSKKADVSIKRILALVADRSSDYFIIEKPFKTRNRFFRRKWTFTYIDEFAEYLEVFVRELVLDTRWKQCSFCGQFILAEKQRTRKCRKCGQGYFNLQPRTKERWVLKYQGERTRIINELLSDGYLKRVLLRKRLDFFHYSGGVFYIYESKNKEKTGLSSKDLRRTLIYPIIINDCGFPVEKLILIYNGPLTKELQRELAKGYRKHFRFEIALWPIKHYLERHGLRIRRIAVLKDGQEYRYRIFEGVAEQIVIDLRQIS